MNVFNCLVEGMSPKARLLSQLSVFKTALRQQRSYHDSGFNQLACQPQAQVLCQQNDGQTVAELMEDQPSRKKQRISNQNNCDISLDYGNDLNRIDDGSQNVGVNGSMINGGPGMQMGMSGGMPPMHGYHQNPNMPNGPQSSMMTMQMSSQPPQQQQSGSILQNLLLNSNTAGTMNSPRQQYSNNFNNRSPGQNAQNMMSPPTSSMAMQQNRIPPQMRQQIPSQMPANSNAPPGAQFPNQRRRPVPQTGMPPQQWPSVQSSTNQQMNMGYGLPSQQNTNIPPQQRGPPLSSNQAQTLDRNLVANYASPQQMHPGMGAQSQMGMPPNNMVENSMMMNPQPPQQNYGGPFVGSLPPHNPNMRSQPSLNSHDPEKRKLIQQQLVLLLHAHRCQQRERMEGSGSNACTLAHCSTMKSVLDHMISCNNGRQCTFAHCASSRQIITHWKNCTKEDCPVCKPLKTYSRSGSGSAPSNLGPNANHLPSQSSFEGPGSLLNDYHPQDPFRSTNPPNKVAPSNGAVQGMMGNTGPNIGPENISNLPPDPPSNSKDWHSSITADLRSHLVGKLVKAIFPSPDPAAIHDQRIKDLISYARKVEKEMFEMANDKEEYYHLLAEKIYKIQKELQEKKNRRLHEQFGTESNRPGQSSSSSGGIPMMGVGSHMGGFGNNGPIQNSHMGGMPPNSVQPYPLPFPTQDPQQQVQQPSHPMQHRPRSQQAASNSMPIPSVSGMHQISQQQPNHMLDQQMHSQNVSLNNIKTESFNSRPESMIQRQNSIKIEPSDSIKIERPPSSVANNRKFSPPPHPIKQERHGELVEEKRFEPNELRSYLKPICDKLLSTDESIPFRVPVDADLLKIPDYYDIIKHPMDLETIGKKLDRGAYKNPWEFCDDMWLMFENAWLYNKKNSKVYKYCTKLNELFIESINPVMQQMGFCCGLRLSFTPLALICYGGQAACSIARDQQYYMYESGSTSYGLTVSDRYAYCLKCFDALPPEGINLSENMNDPPNMVPKERFTLMKNDKIDAEPFEICKYCRRKWHRICALYSKKVFPEGFICKTCQKEKGVSQSENKYTARRLPHCQLSRFIEDRVNNYIRSKLPSKSKDNHEVVIRILCSSEKDVEVKPMMKQKYCPEGFPERFPYKTKAIFAFELIDGVEVCFFGLHVQEYGSRCPSPNRRRVYIAYLDSVHFFQPRELRTDVYHEILLGYLQYVKKLGYTMAHIWACPPSEGDDYIFHVHPPEQKIPKPKRLQDWYKRMLEKGALEDTVYEYKDIHKQAKDDGLQTPVSLPYFEGDFWPNTIEDCIRDVEKEENERKKLEQMAAADDDEEDLFQTDDGVRLKKNTKSSKKKSNLKKLNKQKRKNANGTGNEITDKLFNLFEKHKDIFFTIRLVSQQTELTVNNIEINDPDPLVPSELMDGRDTFLCKARDEHWEFSSMRRAKYSTLNFCYALHTQDNKEMTTYTCNNCGSESANYHCNTCEDFDLCAKCYETIKHEHEMEKIQLLNEDKSSDSANARNESFKRCIQSLVHACTCRDANCRRPTCQKMKRVVQHTKMCKRRQTTTCPVCKQLIALCCYHAKHCNLATCPVPFCSNIRQKLQEQKRSQNRRADMMMRRRIEKLHAASGGGSGPSTSTSSSSQSSSIGTTQMQQPQQHNIHVMASSSQQMHSQNAKPIMNNPHPPSGMQYQQSMTPNKLNPNPMHSQQHMQPNQPQYHRQQMQGGQFQHPGNGPIQQQRSMHPGGQNPVHMGQNMQQQKPPNIMPQQHMQGGQFQQHPGNGGPMNGSNAPPYQQPMNKMNPSMPMHPGQHPNSQYHSQMGMHGQQMSGMHMNQQQMSMQQRQMHPDGMNPQQVNNPQQQQRKPQQGMSGAGMDPPNDVINPQIREIVNRLKMSSAEERKKVISDLKKTPRLFSEFLDVKSSIRPNKTVQGGDSSRMQLPSSQGSSVPPYYPNQ